MGGMKDQKERRERRLSRGQPDGMPSKAIKCSCLKGSLMTKTLPSALG